MITKIKRKSEMTSKFSQFSAGDTFPIRAEKEHPRSPWSQCTEKINGIVKWIWLKLIELSNGEWSH